MAHPLPLLQRKQRGACLRAARTHARRADFIGALGSRDLHSPRRLSRSAARISGWRGGGGGEEAPTASCSVLSRRHARRVVLGLDDDRVCLLADDGELPIGS